VIVILDSSSLVRNLMMAWAVLGRVDATQARVIDVDKDKLSFEIETKHWRTGAKETLSDVYEFTSSPSTSQDVQEEVTTLKSASSLAVWPAGPAPFISVALWLFFIAGMVTKYKTGSPYFNFLKLFASYFLSPPNAKIGLYLLAGSHLLEACYVGYILRPLQLGTVGFLSWTSLTFILGFPVTQKAMFLSRYSNENKKKK
jgi:hypothetical protein